MRCKGQGPAKRFKSEVVCESAVAAVGRVQFEYEFSRGAWAGGAGGRGGRGPFDV